MAELQPLVLKDGRVQILTPPDTIGGVDDFHSGYSDISTGQTVQIRDKKQSINFTRLKLDGELILDGDLWLA